MYTSLWPQATKMGNSSSRHFFSSSRSRSLKPGQPKVSLSKGRSAPRNHNHLENEHHNSHDNNIGVANNSHKSHNGGSASTLSGGVTQNLRHVTSSSRSNSLSSVTEEIELRWKPPPHCKKSSIQGYRIEMWDLAAHTWLEVTISQNPEPYCVLSNILSGMLYQFRIAALTTEGSGEPSEPSEAFIVDIPDVNIAPYWIHTPLARLEVQLHDDLVLRGEALGTPRPSFHWYKEDDTEIFVTDGISIQENQFRSELRVTNVQADDAGKIKCCAINTMGKCMYETELVVTAKPEFAVSEFTRLDQSFFDGEFVRVEIPLVAIPDPELSAIYVQDELQGQGQISRDDVVVKYKLGMAIFQINSAWGNKHAGEWKVRAKNIYGRADASFFLSLKEPIPRPGTPTVLDVTATAISLSWRPPVRARPSDYPSLIYQVEYFRDQWQLWLKGKVVKDSTHCTLHDLVPGSYYKFRIRLHTEEGMSEASGESDSVFLSGEEDVGLGEAGIDGGAGSGLGPGAPEARSARHAASLYSLNRLEANSDPFGFAQGSQRPVRAPRLGSLGPSVSGAEQKKKLGAGMRQSSLDREVYYSGSARNERKEVVTYKAVASAAEAAADKQLGKKVFSKYRLSKIEENIYRQSLKDLCGMLAANSAANSAASSRRRLNSSSNENEDCEELLEAQGAVPNDGEQGDEHDKHDWSAPKPASKSQCPPTTARSAMTRTPMSRLRGSQSCDIRQIQSPSLLSLPPSSVGGSSAATKATVTTETPRNNAGDGDNNDDGNDADANADADASARRRLRLAASSGLDIRDSRAQRRRRLFGAVGGSCSALRASESLAEICQNVTTMQKKLHPPDWQGPAASARPSRPWRPTEFGMASTLARSKMDVSTNMSGARVRAMSTMSLSKKPFIETSL